jgi:hypothetical protein
LLLLFTLLLWAAFAAAARARQRIRGDFGHLLIAAALSISLFQHVASFIGVTYFGQAVLLWHMLLAMIGSIDAHTAAEAAAAAADDDGDAADTRPGLRANQDARDQDREDLLDGDDVVIDWPRWRRRSARREMPCIA